MRRRIFNAIAALSLLLCLASIIVWSCSFMAFAPLGQYWTTSWDGNGSGYTGRGWIAANGSVHLLRNDLIMRPAPTSGGDHHHHSGIDPAPGIQPVQTRLGFTYAHRVTVWREPGSNRQVTLTFQQLSFPVWLHAILFAMPPLGWFVAARRRRLRRKQGGCPACGYNLTGNTSGVCPECGTPAVA